MTARKIKIIAALFFFSIIFFYKQDISADTQYPINIRVASDQWENWTNADSSGLVFDLLQYIFSDTAKYMISVNYMPYIESTKMVIDGTADIVVGVYENEIPALLYPKWNFEIDNITAVYKKKKNIQWNGAKSLEGKKSAFVTGYSYNKYLPVDFQYSEIEDRKIILQMLESDTIDFYLDAVYDINKNFHSNNFDTNLFEIKLIKELKCYFCFTNNDKGKMLAKIWDDTFKNIMFSNKREKMHSLYLKWRKTAY